jgi:hypothetical protein
MTLATANAAITILVTRIRLRAVDDAVSTTFRAPKENGRLRVCANSHYRIVAAKPPNSACHLARRRAARLLRATFSRMAALAYFAAGLTDATSLSA